MQYSLWRRLRGGHERALGIAQRAKTKERTKVIHAKIGRRRKDALHKCDVKAAKTFSRRGIEVWQQESTPLGR